jgi:formamidopyrimidine-DNA glycosylase
VPELPEVETARREAHGRLVGRIIRTVSVNPDPIVFESVSPRRFKSLVQGARVTGTGRRGKHMWLELDRKPWVLFHFGMTGAFHMYDAKAERPRFWKVELELDDGLRFAMTNARRLGRIRLRDEPLNEPPLNRLGPDPVIDLPDVAELQHRLSRRKGYMKAVLLDQTLFAGVGNWIADEVLYQARIAPGRRAHTLSAAEVRILRRTLVRVCQKACDVGADSSRFPRTWLFHVRWGKKSTHTRRGEPIRYGEYGGRTTAWVPSVQK